MINCRMDDEEGKFDLITGKIFSHCANFRFCHQPTIHATICRYICNQKIKYEKNIINAGHFIIRGPEHFRTEIRNI